MNNDGQKAKGLSLYMSNNMETLADICALIMSEYPLDDPFAHEKVVVMNLGMGTFLTQRIAVQNDISCLCDYPQVWQFIYETHRMLHPDAPRQDLFNRDHLTWNIFSQIKLWYSNESAVETYGADRARIMSAGSAAREREALAAEAAAAAAAAGTDAGAAYGVGMSGDDDGAGGSDFESFESADGPDRGPGSIYYRLRRYLDDDVYGDKAYKLSAKIADTLDQYQMYRPRWILEWNRIPLSAFDDYESNPEDMSNPVNRFIEAECRRFVREKSGVNAAMKKARADQGLSGLDSSPLGDNLIDGEEELAAGVDNLGAGLDAGAAGEHVSAERVDRVRNLFRNNVWQIKLWCTLRYNLNMLSSDDVTPNDRQSMEHRWLLENLDRSQIMNNLIARLREDRNIKGLYERIFVFGVSALQRVVIEFLDALSLHCSVNVMLLNPCREYWADIAPRHRNDFDDYVKVIQSSTRSIHERKLNVKKKYMEVPAQNLSLSSYDQSGERVDGHPLLLSYGRQGRDNLYMFFDRDNVPDNISCFSEPDVKEEFQSSYTRHNHQTVEEVTGGTLLAFIQKQLLELEQQPCRYLIADDDRSFSVHSCHTRRREVEILHDALLELFNRARMDGEELYPRDIVVMVPAINEYAPHISAVFGGSLKDGHKDYIPFVISDRTETEANPVGQALLRLLEIGTVRITSALVVELLSEEAIARRFGLSRDDIDVIARWINEGNIFWGLDDDDAARVAEINIPGTFEQGMDRMILGSMLGDSTAMPCYSEIEGMDAITLGHMWDFIQALRELRSHFTPELSLSPETWSLELREMLTSRFFDDSEETVNALAPVHKVVEDLKTVFGHLDHKPSINLPVFAATLREGLTSERNFRPFLREKVNFCSLVPMRAVPFKHVFILGLNDIDFPREERAPGFNLISNNELFERGDRSRSIDDRFLFLEAILSARKSLYLSYIGQSPVDRTVLNPSIVLDELLYYVCDSCAVRGFENESKGRRQSMVLERVLIREHLNSYNQGNYTSPSWSKLREKAELKAVPARLSDLRVPSFDRSFIMMGGGDRHMAPLLADGIFFPEAADNRISVLDLRTLSGFISDPSRFFVRNLLRIRLDDRDDTAVSEDENFELDGFDVSVMVDELLRVPEEERQSLLEHKAHLGGLPYGIFKNKLLRNISDVCNLMASALKENFNISYYDELEYLQCPNSVFKLKLPRTLFDGICTYHLMDLAAIQESSIQASLDPQSRSETRKSMLSDGQEWLDFEITLQAAALSRPILAYAFNKVNYTVSSSRKADAVNTMHDSVALYKGYEKCCSPVLRMTREAIAQYLYDGGLKEVSMVDRVGRIYVLDSFTREEMAITINIMLIGWLAGQAAPFPCMKSLMRSVKFSEGAPVIPESSDGARDVSFSYDPYSVYLYGNLDNILRNPRLKQLGSSWLDFYLSVLAPKLNPVVTQ